MTSSAVCRPDVIPAFSPLKMPSRFPGLNNLIDYIKANLLFALVVTYFFLSAAIMLVFSIDLMIPCLIETVFDVHCPGCGLSTAFLSLIKLELSAAWESNPMIFIVLPAGIYYVTTDFLTFRKNKTGA